MLTRAVLQNHPHAAQQGVPQPNPLQHPRSAGLIQQQQHRSNSPQQPANAIHSSSQVPYASPHSSTHSLSQQQHPSPYVGSVPSIPPHHPGETTFFGAHPSPYSSNSAPGSYASSEPGDSMAAQAAISRPQYPPISSYQTPQSNPPSSIHSPQTDAHGRPMYGMASMPQQMYYQAQPQYQMQQSPYAQQPQSSHHPSVTSAPGTLLPYQQALQQQQQHQQSQQQSNIMDSKPHPSTLQRPSTVIAPPHGTPQTPSGPQVSGLPPSSGNNPSAAPGPIPATTPLVVRQDNNGVQWIAFEYSRDRVKMEYTIRCDVESVNTEELSADFKAANCVYPRACHGKDQYKGNRLQYETECNAVGWALAQLNPPLREKRGLIQRAVDSWRNSNQDVKLRSRRVRRMAKLNTRKSGPGMTPGAAGQQPGQGPSSAGLHTSQGMTPGSARPFDFGPGGLLQHHHHSDGHTMVGGGGGIGNEYNSAPAHHHQAPAPTGHPDVTSPNTTSSSNRYNVAQNFYPSYPQQQNVAGPGAMPSIHDAMDPMHPHSSTLAAAASSKEPEESRKRKLFGDVPEGKRRKFILVEDVQRNTRVRVRVTLEDVNMDEMPDAHLKVNAVFPRSYYPRQVGSPAASPRTANRWDDEDDENGAVPTRSKTMVRVPLMDGSTTEMPVPRMTTSRRNKEIALNELGARMCWAQARTFSGRTLFLQKSLDGYRNKMRSTMVSDGQDVAALAPHFITRLGKQKWLDRSRRSRHESP